MGKLILVFLIVGVVVHNSTNAQTDKVKTVAISFDRHVITVLEGMYLTKKIENTCGEINLAGPDESKDMDNFLYLDSIDRQHTRLQVGNTLDNNEFPNCNLSLFTNKGILSLQLVFDNATSDLVRVFRESDLIYKYDNETQLATKGAVLEAEKSEIPRITKIFNETNEPDFSQTAESDLVDFTLTNIIFDGDQVFLFVVLKNNSSIPYELGGVYFHKVIKASGGRKSAQEFFTELPIKNKIEPSDKVIPENEFKVLCYQLDKFTLTKKNLLKIDVAENNGSRKIEIRVSRNTFNSNAVTFSE